MGNKITKDKDENFKDDAKEEVLSGTSDRNTESEDGNMKNKQKQGQSRGARLSWLSKITCCRRKDYAYSKEVDSTEEGSIGDKIESLQITSQHHSNKVTAAIIQLPSYNDGGTRQSLLRREEEHKNHEDVRELNDNNEYEVTQISQGEQRSNDDETNKYLPRVDKEKDKNKKSNLINKESYKNENEKKSIGKYKHTVLTNTHPKPPSLRNIGATCYLNSAFQGISACDTFVREINDLFVSKDGSSLNQLHVFKALMDILNGCFTSQMEISRNPIFRDWNKPGQQDSYELLAYALNQVYNQIRKYMEQVGSIQPRDLKRWLQEKLPMRFLMQYQIVCGCGHMTNSPLQSDLALHVTIPRDYKKSLLNELIDIYFSEDPIEGYECDQPGCSGSGTSRIVLLCRPIPRTICVHLQRTFWNGYSMVKINKDVVFKTDLTLKSQYFYNEPKVGECSATTDDGESSSISCSDDRDGIINGGSYSVNRVSRADPMNHGERPDDKVGNGDEAHNRDIETENKTLVIMQGDEEEQMFSKELEEFVNSIIEEAIAIVAKIKCTLRENGGGCEEMDASKTQTGAIYVNEKVNVNGGSETQDGISKCNNISKEGMSEYSNEEESNIGYISAVSVGSGGDTMSLPLKPHNNGNTITKHISGSCEQNNTLSYDNVTASGIEIGVEEMKRMTKDGLSRTKNDLSSNMENSNELLDGFCGALNLHELESSLSMSMEEEEIAPGPQYAKCKIDETKEDSKFGSRDISVKERNDEGHDGCLMKAREDICFPDKRLASMESPDSEVVENEADAVIKESNSDSIETHMQSEGCNNSQSMENNMNTTMKESNVNSFDKIAEGPKDGLVEKDENYSLVSVIVHSGTVYGGHYICYKRVGDRWFLTDDSHVKEVSEEHVLSCQAYILFYEQPYIIDKSRENNSQ